MKELASVPGVVALVMKAEMDSGDVSPLTTFYIRVMMQSSKFAGFLSAEVIPPISKSDPKWVLVEWFRSQKDLDNWQKSDIRKALKDEFMVRFPNVDISSEEVSSQVGSRGSVTSAIITNVKPGMEDAYGDWEKRIKLAQTKFAGYRGTYYQPPMDKDLDQWISWMRFDSPESLDNWLLSDERRKLLIEQKQYILSREIHQITSSFPGWFPDSKTGHKIEAWKTSMLVFLCLYPLTVLQFHYVRPLLAHLPNVFITFVTNLTTVILMTWLCMPFAVKVFANWLEPNQTRNESNLKGIFILLALYVLEVSVLFMIAH